MLNRHKRAFDYLMLGYIVLALCIAALIARGLLAAGEADVTLVRQDAKRNAEATALAMDKEIGSLQHLAHLFVHSHRATLDRILAAPDPDSLIFELDELAEHWFPHALAFTLSNADGRPVISDFKGGIGPVCLNDLHRAATGKLSHVPLHGLDSVPHFDVVVALPGQGPRHGNFMVSFTLAGFAATMAIPTDAPYRIEFAATDRKTEGEIFLAPVSRSDLLVIGTVSPAYLAGVERNLRRDFLLYVGAFALFAGLGGALLWRARRRMLADAGNLHRLNRELEHLAHTDPLTRLGNRRSLWQRAATTLAQADREGKTVTLALIDLDHFKHINDTQGHAFGDACLAAVAAVVGKTAQRPLDIAVRYGGEEFLVCWYDTGREQATELVSVIADGLRGLPQRHADGQPLTASIGIVVRPPADTGDLDALLRTADGALYRAKIRGRDRIEFA